MMFIKHYVPNRCLCIKVANSIDHWVEDCKDVTKAGGGGYVQRMEVIVKRKKSQGRGQGRCERRSEAFVKIQKKHFFFIFLFFVGGVGLGVGLGGGGVQGGYEWRSEAFVKIKKKIGGRGLVRGGGGLRGWVRVDVN